MGQTFPPNYCLQSVEVPGGGLVGKAEGEEVRLERPVSCRLLLFIFVINNGMNHLKTSACLLFELMKVFSFAAKHFLKTVSWLIWKHSFLYKHPLRTRTANLLKYFSFLKI